MTVPVTQWRRDRESESKTYLWSALRGRNTCNESEASMDVASTMPTVASVLQIATRARGCLRYHAECPRALNRSTTSSSDVENTMRIVASATMVGVMLSRMPLNIWRGTVT